MKAVFVSFLLMLGAQLIGQDYLPDIMVEKMNGQKVSILDEVKNNGRSLTIINFWATWCKPCRSELENIALIYPDWQEAYDVELIAVSIDDTRTQPQIRPYVNGQGFEYNIVLDANRLFFQAVNGITPPLTLLVNNRGEILEVEHGYIEGNEYKMEEKLAELAGE